MDTTRVRRLSRPAGMLLLAVGVLLWLSNCTLIPTPPPADPPAELLPAPTDEPGGPSYAHVLFVRVTEESDGTWRFDVTVQHSDEGEEHFADRWEVLLLPVIGEIEGYTRELSHPHVDEQPFTRSLSGIEISAEIVRVVVRAHDSLHGYGGQEVTVDINVAAGPGFQVIRRGE